MASLPTGSVTFLCADIEGFTRLPQQLGDRYADVLTDHRRLLRTAIHNLGGREVNTQGDACFFAFPRARDALSAAVAALRAIHRYPRAAGSTLRVRMGLHTGEPLSAGADYTGLDVRRAARICAAGNGGQILLSQTVRDLVGDDVPKDVSLRDLGQHRLKDLALPQHLFQVVHPHLPSEFPPLRTLDVLPHNLPIQLTSFIGREREIAQVKGFLSTTRLFTLTGAGGAGKSRLAFQVAAEALEDFADGVWIVELASLADPALVPQAIASVLSVPEQPGRPLKDTLADALRHKALLLVLDNCEHLQPACALLVDVLLRRCPQLRILATSRAALGVPGETLWRIPSLSLPDHGRVPSLVDLQQYEAVRLFVERARAGQPTFALTPDSAPAVGEVCQRLDGIPLAIELAAARTRVLAVEQIAARLDDRFRLLTGGSAPLPRHQALLATMDWSYGLLAEQERILLRRLSVFAGGWTLEAAEAVCAGEGVEERDILDLLTQLVDKSLVVMETQRSEARYRLLETVRQYGRDRLQEVGEAASVRRRHQNWYLQLAERADTRVRGPEENVWLKRVEVEHDNLRAALELSKAEEDGAETELRLARALEWFWYLLGHWSEGRARLENAIARRKDASPSNLPKVLVGTARLAYRQGDLGRTKALCEQGLTLCRKLGDKSGTAQFLIWSAIVAIAEARHEEAAPLLEESLALCREIGDRWWAVEALAILGTLATLQGDYERASTFHTESLAVSRETGNTNNMTYALRSLGVLAVRQGDWGRAATYYKECLTLSRSVRTPGVIAECLEGTARAASLRAAYDQAARLFGAADALFQVLGGHLPLWADESEHDRYVASTRAALGEAAFAGAWRDGRAMTLEQAVEYALASAEAAPPKVQGKEKLRKDTAADLLTAREREVAALVAHGLTNRQIAAKLVVTERTAETHVQNILNKLGFTSRAQVAAWAVEQGLHTPTKQ